MEVGVSITILFPRVLHIGVDKASGSDVAFGLVFLFTHRLCTHVVQCPPVFGRDPSSVMSARIRRFRFTVGRFEPYSFSFRLVVRLIERFKISYVTKDRMLRKGLEKFVDRLRVLCLRWSLCARMLTATFY